MLKVNTNNKNTVSKFKVKASNVFPRKVKHIKYSRFSTPRLYPKSFFTTFVQSLTSASQRDFTYQRLATKNRLKAQAQLVPNLRQGGLGHNKNVHVVQSLPLNYLALFLKKASLHQQAQKMVWKGRFGGVRQSRFFKQINRSRILPRLEHRIFKLSALRLRHLYVFDIIVLWIYFFFKKIASFIKFFFYVHWCSLYMFLFASGDVTGRLSTDLVFYFGGDSQTFFENYFMTNKIKARGLVNSKFATLTLYPFTNLFKLMCVFWNKRKQKHYIFRIASRRWKKKFRSLKRKGKRKKYIPFWKKIKTTRFFIPGKILRLKFRRQHGYKIINDYPLRVQVRRLKPKMRRKLPKPSIPARPITEVSNHWLLTEPFKKILKPGRAYDLSRYVRTFLEGRRKLFLRQFIAPTTLGQNQPIFETPYVRREICLLKRLGESLAFLSPFSFIGIIQSYCNYLRSRNKLGLKKKTNYASSSLSKLFYGADLWIEVLQKVLENTNHEATLSAYTPKELLNIFNTSQPLPAVPQKKIQRRMLGQVPWSRLYEDLVAHQLKIRRSVKAKRSARNRTIKAAVNRRKLLLAINFKTILSKASRAPTFSFSMARCHVVA